MLVEYLLQKLQQKPLDTDIKLVTYGIGRMYHLSSAHTPPKGEAGGFPAH